MEEERLAGGEAVGVNEGEGIAEIYGKGNGVPFYFALEARDAILGGKAEHAGAEIVVGQRDGHGVRLGH